MGSVLREGWEVKSLKEIGETQTGNTPATKEIDNYGDYIPFVKPAHFKIDGSIDSKDSALSEKGLKSARLFKANSILMVCIGATIGKTGFSKIEVTSNQQINAFTPPQEFEAKFFYYLFIADEFQNKIIKNSAQATLPIINKSKWENLLVSFPKEKKEQQKIVTILDEAFSAIEKVKANAELNLKNAKEFFESYLQRVFENKGEGWEEKRLGELCELTRGHNPPKSKFINEPKEGYVRFYQIRDGWSDDYIVYVPDTPQLHRVEPSDILMVAYRHIGKVFRGVSGAFNVALCKISNVRRDLLEDDFLFYMVPTDVIRGELMKRSERSLIPSMSVNHLKEIVIPLPPLKTQQTIVKKLDALSIQTKKLETIYEQKIKDLDELKKSILQKAFNGELI